MRYTYHNSYYKIPYRTTEVESLVALSTRVAANYVAYNMHLTQLLAPTAKNVLVTLLGRRNLLSNSVLRALAHKDLETISLTGAHARDSTIEILQYVTKLKSLNIPENQMSTSGLLQLFPYLPHLKELNISCNPQVTDELLKVLADSCPGLYLLNLGRCTGISDQGVKYLASNLYSLVVLDISFTKVTDASLKALAESPSKSRLKELHIDGCRELTAECGQYLQLLSNITVISFYDCPRLVKSDWFESFSKEQKNRMKNMSFTIE